MNQKIKTLYLLTRDSLSKIFVFNGRKDAELTQDDVLRTGFKNKGEDLSNAKRILGTRNDGLRG